MNELLLTPQQAISLLQDGDIIKTVVVMDGKLIGRDHSRTDIIERINNAESLEVAGPGLRGLGYAIALEEDWGHIFLAHDAEKLDIFDPE